MRKKTKTGYAQKKRCQSRNRVVSPGRLWWRVYLDGEVAGRKPSLEVAPIALATFSISDGRLISNLDLGS